MLLKQRLQVTAQFLHHFDVTDRLCRYAHVLSNFDLAQCVCDGLLVESDGDDSVVDFEFVD